MEESVLVLERLHRSLVERNEQERWSFEGLVSSNSALRQEVCALRRGKVEMEREIAGLRIEAADVVGRSDAIEAAARLEVRVVELQKDLKVSRLACEASRATEKSSQLALGETSLELAERSRLVDKLRADVAVLEAQRDESRRDVSTLKGELERAVSARDATEEEMRMYRRENEDLVQRLLRDKERSVTEMNSMNEIIDRLRNEILILKGRIDDGEMVVIDKAPEGDEETFFSSSSPMRRCLQVHENDAVDIASSMEGMLTVTASTTSGCLAFKSSDYVSRQVPLENTVGALSVAATDSLCAVACADRSIRLFDRHGRRRNEFGSAHSATTAKIHSVVFSSKSSLISGATDRQLKLWDVRRGAAVGSRRAPSAVHSVVSPHPSSFVSAHYDGLVRVWDSRAAETSVAEVKASDSPLAGLAVGPNFLAALGRDASLKILDQRTLGTLAAVSHQHLKLLPNAIVRIAADQKTVFVPSASGKALLFDAKTGHCTAELFDEPHAAPPASQPQTQRHTSAPLVALDLDYSKNNKKVLLTLDARGFLRVWDCA